MSSRTLALSKPDQNHIKLRVTSAPFQAAPSQCQHHITQSVNRNNKSPAISDPITLPTTQRNAKTMASLSARHPTLALHLSDANLSTIFSSAHSASSSSHDHAQLTALTTLQNASLNSYSASARLGLGTPQRIMIETAQRGPIVLHSYVVPPRRTAAAAPAATHPRGRDLHPEERVLAQTRDGLHALSDTAEEVEQQQQQQSQTQDQDPAQASSSLGSSSGETGATALTNGVEEAEVRGNGNGNSNGNGNGHAWDAEDDDGDADDDAAVQAPLLVATVVAPSAAQGVEARRAIARLERVGAEVQREWLRERRVEAEEEGNG